MPWELLSSGSLIGAGIFAPKIICWHDWWTQASPKRSLHRWSICFHDTTVDCPHDKAPRAIKGETGVFYDLVLEEIFCQQAELYLSHRRTLMKLNADREECESRSLGAR